MNGILSAAARYMFPSFISLGKFAIGHEMEGIYA